MLLVLWQLIEDRLRSLNDDDHLQACIAAKAKFEERVAKYVQAHKHVCGQTRSSGG